VAYKRAPCRVLWRLIWWVFCCLGFWRDAWYGQCAGTSSYILWRKLVVMDEEMKCFRELLILIHHQQLLHVSFASYTLSDEAVVERVKWMDSILINGNMRTTCLGQNTFLEFRISSFKCIVAKANQWPVF